MYQYVGCVTLHSLILTRWWCSCPRLAQHLASETRHEESHSSTHTANHRSFRWATQKMGQLSRHWIQTLTSLFLLALLFCAPKFRDNALCHSWLTDVCLMSAWCLLDVCLPESCSALKAVCGQSERGTGNPLCCHKAPWRRVWFLYVEN